MNAPVPGWTSSSRWIVLASRPVASGDAGALRAPAILFLGYGSSAVGHAMMLERADLKVVVVPSTPANVKITTPADLPLAGAVLSWEIEADV